MISTRKILRTADKNETLSFSSNLLLYLELRYTHILLRNRAARVSRIALRLSQPPAIHPGKFLSSTRLNRIEVGDRWRSHKKNWLPTAVKIEIVARGRLYIHKRRPCFICGWRGRQKRNAFGIARLGGGGQLGCRVVARSFCFLRRDAPSDSVISRVSNWCSSGDSWLLNSDVT